MFENEYKIYDCLIVPLLPNRITEKIQGLKSYYKAKMSAQSKHLSSPPHITIGKFQIN